MQIIFRLYLCASLLIATSLYSQKNDLNFGLGGLHLLNDAETFSISPENPTGEKGKGGMAVPGPDVPFSDRAQHLGQGWKVSPFLRPMPGETITIMDVEGPAIIQHIWMTTERKWQGNGRACILRFYWDHEETPSVEVPMTDFFAVGHDEYAPVNSLPVIVNPSSALNCYWPMPFRKHAKITFTNESDKPLMLLTYQITCARTEVPENAGYFHAQWRKAVVNPDNPDYLIVDNIKGKGKYVGTFLSWTQLHSGWFGEGEIKFFMDGDKKFPTICGTGTEDYFCGSYGFPETFSTVYVGNTLGKIEGDGPRKWSLYGWHIMDPIHFKKDLKITIQALGWYRGKPHGYRPLADDIASVAYWYQTEPHAKFPKLPELKDRWPR